MTTIDAEAAVGSHSAATGRPTRLQLMLAGLALAFVAGSAGFTAGSRSSPPRAESVDVGFLYDMIAHHEQALTLSNAELMTGSDTQAKAFAREILLFQSYEIGLMERQLSIWGYDRQAAPPKAMVWMGEPVSADAMPGMASPSELAIMSRASGELSDALFIALMQDHHRGGVHMAEVAATEAASPFIRDLAARMARNQKLEIREMENARQKGGLPADPPGYERDSSPASQPAGGRHHVE